VLGSSKRRSLSGPEGLEPMKSATFFLFMGFFHFAYRYFSYSKGFGLSNHTNTKTKNYYPVTPLPYPSSFSSCPRRPFQRHTIPLLPLLSTIHCSTDLPLTPGTVPYLILSASMIPYRNFAFVPHCYSWFALHSSIEAGRILAGDE